VVGPLRRRSLAGSGCVPVPAMGDAASGSNLPLAPRRAPSPKGNWPMTDIALHAQTEHEADVARVRRLHAQVAAARAAGDRQALEGLLDALGRHECRLSATERDHLWLESIRGIEPAPFEHTKSKQPGKRLDREDPE
jgi:hypothetical protein